MRTLMIGFAVCLSVAAVAVSSGCSSPTTSDYDPNTGSGMMGSGSNTTQGGGPGSGPGGGMMGGSSGANSYSSLGEQIYLTGVGTDGRSISRTAPAVSQGSLMMGGGGCGSCHAANGRGGTITMMTGTAVKAPDITYDALIEEGFTDATIKRAIRDGVDESGKPLEAAMPRWQMGDADADAVVGYLRELSAP